MRLKTVEELLKALSGDLIRMNIELLQLHGLLLECLRQVCHRVIIELRVRQVERENV